MRSFGLMRKELEVRLRSVSSSSSLSPSLASQHHKYHHHQYRSHWFCNIQHIHKAKQQQLEHRPHHSQISSTTMNGKKIVMVDRKGLRNLLPPPPSLHKNSAPPPPPQFRIGALLERDLDQTGDPITQFLQWYAELQSPHPSDQEQESECVRQPVPETCTLSTAHFPSGRVSARTVYLKEVDHAGFIIYSNWNTSQKSADLQSNPNAALTFWWNKFERQVRVEGTIEWGVDVGRTCGRANDHSLLPLSSAPLHRSPDNLVTGTDTGTDTYHDHDYDKGNKNKNSPVNRTLKYDPALAQRGLQYFQSRPRQSQIGAWASAQSTVLTDRAQLDSRVQTEKERWSNPKLTSGHRGAVNDPGDHNQSESIVSHTPTDASTAATTTPIECPPFWGPIRIVPDRIEFWQGRESRLHDRILFRRPDRSHPQSSHDYANNGEWIVERLSP